MKLELATCTVRSWEWRDRDAIVRHANNPNVSINLRDRINDLEQSLSEERRALRECEERYGELEARYNELLQSSVSASVTELEA